MINVPTANFSPELVAIMKSALDAAVDRVDPSHTEHLPPRRRWHNGSS
jgi:hypothetical protein